MDENLKGLGQRQLKILNMMNDKDLVIREFLFLHSGTEIKLQNKSQTHTFKIINSKFFSSFEKRNLFISKRINKSIRHSVIKHKLKKSVKHQLKKIDE